MKFKAKITELGDTLKDLFDSEDMLILFDQNAPDELKDVALIHTANDYDQDLKVGDNIKIGPDQFTITAIGTEANKTLKELGHCTFVFKDEDTTELPGQVYLKGEKPTFPSVGEIIEVL